MDVVGLLFSMALGECLSLCIDGQSEKDQAWLKR